MAVLAADAAGYSRLVGPDEAGAVAALKACRREIIDPEVARHGGRIVGPAGDSVLAAFECAVAIQRGIAGRHRSAPTGERRSFRIGIHLDEVTLDGDDILGDGVNVAHGWKPSPPPARSAPPAPCSTGCGAGSSTASPTSGSSASRTSPSRCAGFASIRPRPTLRVPCRSRTSRRCRCRRSPRLPFCRSRTLAAIPGRTIWRTGSASTSRRPWST